MHGIVHPYSRALYESEDGMVKVTTADGHVGYFAQDGHWLEGEKFDADLHLCGWVGGPRGVHRLNTASH